MKSDLVGRLVESGHRNRCSRCELRGKGIGRDIDPVRAGGELISDLVRVADDPEEGQLARESRPPREPEELERYVVSGRCVAGSIWSLKR